MLAALLGGCGASEGVSAPTLPVGAGPQVEIITSVPEASGIGDSAARPLSVIAHALGPAVVARAEPTEAAEVVAELANPIASGSELVFLVAEEESTDSDWVHVLLPVTPNGTTGWVRRDEVTLTNNPYRVEIDRASFSLRVFDLDQVIVETTIGVGTGETPTPVGDFYLLELLAPPDPSGPYGPYAFGLSGFSEVLEDFGGADTAVIGLHGTNDPASLGTNASHGCIRLANEVIVDLAERLPLGTPVHIT
jgi:lipoprotein-anchoring transpeptidase ErfK/SrfK